MTFRLRIEKSAVSSREATIYSHAFKVLLAVSCAMVFFAAFPTAWYSLCSAAGVAGGAMMRILWAVLWAVDVRNWTWMVFAALSAISIFALVGIKSWLEQ